MGHLGYIFCCLYFLTVMMSSKEEEQGSILLNHLPLIVEALAQSKNYISLCIKASL